MVRNFWPIYIMFFFVFFCNIIKVNQFLYFFIILLHLISSFLLTRYFLIPYAYASMESIDCIYLSSFELKSILIIFSVKTLCHSLLNFCCVFNISFFNELFAFFCNKRHYLCQFHIILNNLFYYQVELLLKGFFQFSFFSNLSFLFMTYFSWVYSFYFFTIFTLNPRNFFHDFPT